MKKKMMKEEEGGKEDGGCGRSRRRILKIEKRRVGR